VNILYVVTTDGVKFGCFQTLACISLGFWRICQCLYQPLSLCWWQSVGSSGRLLQPDTACTMLSICIGVQERAMENLWGSLTSCLYLPGYWLGSVCIDMLWQQAGLSVCSRQTDLCSFPHYISAPFSPAHKMLMVSYTSVASCNWLCYQYYLLSQQSMLAKIK